MSMFPTPFSPGDPNRSWRDDYAEGDGVPNSLTIAWVLTVGAAALMLISAIIMLTAGFQGGDAPLEVIAAFERSQRVVAVSNILGAVALGWTVAAMRRGVRHSRRWYTALSALVIAVNVAGFVVTVASFAAIVIVGLLAFALVYAFRPSATAYLR
ncbi:hypothetical protein [Corynebacterium tapiri]|uniref:Tellurium resistance protein TerC n=1 Tax=Corynebacterium tapiri TaxID=1448266 RepID=A0A5C4U318_9CORY|nr:hypothetical protein [Corynebacterium tapiri]TNL97297.1 hypothetical protein FHE74_06390 [Corynebacterium tapiri]